MIRFVVQRIVLLIVALFMISAIVFLALRVLPGDVATVMAGVNAPEGKIAQLRQQFGLDKPLLDQYISWLLGVLHGDFGTSMITGRSVYALIAVRASITFPLICCGLLLAVTIGITLGCWQVAHPDSLWHRILSFFSLSVAAIPSLWAGMLLMLLLGKGIGLFGVLPTQGFPNDHWKNAPEAFLSLLLPSLIVGLLSAASFMRYTVASLKNGVCSQVASMALAAGMTQSMVVRKVALPLALPQLVSVIGLTFAHMITSVMVVENLCALPGLGSGLVHDIGMRDLVAVQGELCMLAAFFVVIGLLVDMLHRILDPRLALQDLNQ